MPCLLMLIPLTMFVAAAAAAVCHDDVEATCRRLLLFAFMSRTSEQLISVNVAFKRQWQM